MSNCKHCGKGFSCGCQKTKAKDGAIVHKTCKIAYEGLSTTKLKAKPDSLTKAIRKAQNNLK